MLPVLESEFYAEPLLVLGLTNLCVHLFLAKQLCSAFPIAFRASHFKLHTQMVGLSDFTNNLFIRLSNSRS